jgi:hypothetical protein
MALPSASKMDLAAERVQQWGHGGGRRGREEDAPDIATVCEVCYVGDGYSSVLSLLFCRLVTNEKQAGQR